MAKQTINLGTVPTGAGGDTPRSAFTKTENNFAEIYSFLGATGSPASLPTGPVVSTFSGIELTANIPYIDFHYGSSTADFTARIAGGPAGVIDITGEVKVSSSFGAQGIRCRLGTGGAFRGNSVYNYDWNQNGNMDTYVNNTYVGTVTLFTSDYRIKKYIKDAAPTSYLDRIDAYRIVNFQKKSFEGVFSGDGTTFQGLIAHEVQAVNPLAVMGEKDGADENGRPRVQQLEPIALITDLMGAIKELRAELGELKASLQPAAM